MKYISEQSFSFSENLLKTFSRLLQFNVFVFWGHLFIEDRNFSRFIMIENRETFRDLSRYWLWFKLTQYQKTHYILNWCDKMSVCLWQISTWHYNDNVIMLIPHSILLFGFKTFIIIWFIAIIQRFFGNTNFPSSKTSLTPLWEKNNVSCEWDCFAYQIFYQTLLILLHFVNQSIRNIFLIGQIKKLHTFKLQSAYIIAYIIIHNIVKTYLQPISQ